MSDSVQTDATPASLATVPTLYPASRPIDEQLDTFWQTGPEFDAISIEAPSADDPVDAAEEDDKPSVLEQLGPSPFERGGFPVVGFLATTYDHVSRYVRECSRK